jgi:alpha-L-fucosidase
MNKDEAEERIIGSVPNETPEERDARMAWWREATFGMFIHWGVYAVLAGEYKGERNAEWIMLGCSIPVDEYRDYAKQFTAENYDPEAWADLAVKAGMRYVVITAKHHDGFALFPSAVTDWDVTDATPYGKDLIAPLAKATRDRGLKFGLYYSHAQDWMHPGGGKGLHYKFIENPGWDEAHKGDYDEYLKNISVPQVKEILTMYQPDVLWYDTPVNMTPERAKPFSELVSLRPGLIVNNRLGGGYQGDIETPEGFIPPQGYPDGRDWETCMTTNDNWGYVFDDDDWKSFDQLRFNLVDVVSKGGNYLLNVGPDATGRIPQPAVDVLEQIGEWLERDGEAIYGVSASPFLRRLPWGRCTVKPHEDNAILYLHILNWPEGGRILLPGLQNRILSAHYLDQPEALSVEGTAHGPVVMLSKQRSTVIKLLIEGKPDVVETPVLPDEDGVIRLTPIDAELHGEVQPGQYAGVDRVGGWEKTDDRCEWNVEALHPGRFRMLLKATTPEGKGALQVNIADIEVSVEVSPTKRWRRDYLDYDLGEIQLEKRQPFKVGISTTIENEKPVYVNVLELIPID